MNSLGIEESLVLDRWIMTLHRRRYFHLLIHVISEQNFSISEVCYISLTQHLQTSDLLTASLLFHVHCFVLSAPSESAHRFLSPIF